MMFLRAECIVWEGGQPRAVDGGSAVVEGGTA